MQYSKAKKTLIKLFERNIFTFFSFHAVENVKRSQKRVGVFYFKTTKIFFLSFFWITACHNVCLETTLWALETLIVRGTQYRCFKNWNGTDGLGPH